MNTQSTVLLWADKGGLPFQTDDTWCKGSLDRLGMKAGPSRETESIHFTESFHYKKESGDKMAEYGSRYL